MSLVLRSLTLSDEKAFFEGFTLFSDMDLSWYTFFYKDGMSFDDYVTLLESKSQGKNLNDGHVPDSMLYAFYDGIIVGRSSIRHELNDYLKQKGGHIGYAVATVYRHRGFATEILKQSLDYCRVQLKLNEVLVTCDDDNVGSIKTIEKNGGVLQDKVTSIDGSLATRRYWIKL